MATVITGHTYGLGKALYNHFPNSVGLSRINGYDIEKDFDRVVEAIKGADLFINNAYANHSQVKLFNAVKDHVDKIVCMGSIARLYANSMPSQYATNKQELYDAVRVHNMTPGTVPVLHLDISFLEKESFDDPKIVQPDNFITFDEVIKIIEFWLASPTFTNIELGWKLSNNLKKELLKVHDIKV